MADPMPSDEQSPAEIRAILTSGMWDGAWARATILRLLDKIDPPAPERSAADDDPRYQDRLWEGTA